MKKKEIKTDIFINECSLQGQFQTIEQFEKAIREFMDVFRSIKQKDTLNTQLYKNNVFVNFQAIKKSPFRKSLNEIRDKSLKKAFIELIFNKINPIDWHDQQKHQTTDRFVLTKTSQNVTDTSIAEISERKLQRTELTYLLINFSCSDFQTPHLTFQLCRLIVVVKNQAQKICLDCLDNKNAFEEWVQDKLDSRDFLERNSERFKRTGYYFQGATVYIENETKNYWYLDSFHKNHYEVFDNQGKHLGEADLSGIINTNKQDKAKKFKC